MDKKEFTELDRRIKAELPDMMSRQLIHVEGWGNCPGRNRTVTPGALGVRELMDNYLGEDPAEDPE